MPINRSFQQEEKTIESTINDWLKMGFSTEEANKLYELSKLNINDMAEIDVNTASESLIKCMKQYHIDMNDKRNKSIIDKVNSLS